MSGVDPEAIRRALAAQVKANIDDDWNVYPHQNPSGPQPRIEVLWDEGLNPWESMTETGLASLSLLLRATFDGGGYESEFIRSSRLMSIGTGHGSSLIDAVMVDRNLGGACDDLIAAPPGSPATATDGNEEVPTSVTVPVLVYVRKQGAEV